MFIVNQERWQFCPRDGQKLEAEWGFCPKCALLIGAIVPPIANQPLTSGSLQALQGQYATPCKHIYKTIDPTRAGNRCLDCGEHFPEPKIATA